ncbi:MAG: DNA-processing protein DprA [Microgenomates group bacterium]
MLTEEERCFIGFSVFPGIGPVRFRLLLSYFGSAAAAWHASEKALASIHLSSSLCASFIAFRKTFSIDAYIKQMEKEHVIPVPLTHPHYPKLLQEISDAPFVLYVKGKSTTPVDMEKTIAIVGTRRATSYGRDVTKTLVTDFVAAGCTIVSGMAYGIDAVAHETAIANNGKTIAVLGCGVDVCAPAENRHIYDAVTLKGFGAAVSEMPLGLRPNKGLFPARNRIISGLSRAVIVVEGALDSGALITARYAAEQGRDVFAVPGAITSPMSRAPTKLIKDGAQIAESANDVLSSLGLANIARSDNNKNTRVVPKGKNEQIILDLVNHESLHIDALIELSGLTASSVTASITVLELGGLIKDVGGNVYAINHR